jgi:hypothetical protein
LLAVVAFSDAGAGSAVSVGVLGAVAQRSAKKALVDHISLL